MQARMTNPAMILPDAMQAIQALYKTTGKGGVGLRSTSGCCGRQGMAG